ncbi:uncharacterized protein LOC133187022 [Saccostrea echinata]|uniref:uncharacterized protein LOC133187022 n=1 Tax=Saccostrea echinata TaxID=191078 RepID=UPI002A7F7782|nr:uncharacterized protein LOC133187022 [Saccostrea echinata]
MNTHFGLESAANSHSDFEEDRSTSDQDDTPSDPNRLDRIRNFVLSQSGNELSDCESENENDTPSELNDIKQNCKCGQRCFSKFENSVILDHVFNVREMEKDVKDLYIMGSISIAGSSVTRKGSRVRNSYHFSFRNVKICRSTFQCLFDVGKKSLSNLLKHYSANGAVPRPHGNHGRKPKHAVRFDDVQRVVNFILGYAEEHGLPQPAAPRGRDDEPPIFLPCNSTKKAIHGQYKSACDTDDVRKVEYHTFTNIWNSCCSHVKICGPRFGVCHKCELLRKRVLDARSEEDKLEALREFQNHIDIAQKERYLYKKLVKDSLEELQDIDRQEHHNQPLSSDMTKVHYTFDFSQSVALPHHARQMGALYFLTLKKVHIFGFRVDDKPMQYNYLIGENETLGLDRTHSHGPDTVISLVHHGLGNYGYGEKECLIHADNCAGQNKNKFLIAYFAWRVITGLHHQITYLMQVVGHTRCLIDAGFARAKKLFRRTDCDSMSELQRVFDHSSTTNKGILYDNGRESTWKYYGWKEFLGRFFNSLPGISKYHSFRFHVDFPGFVFVKENSDSAEKKIKISKPDGLQQIPGNFPRELAPLGMSRERAQYLYKKVRPYVRPRCQDELCPPAQTEE